MRLLGVGALVLALTTAAAADPATPPAAPAFAHFQSPRIACRGTLESRVDCIQLAPGYFMDEAAYERLDLALKSLQDDKTRLSAENGALRTAASSWRPGWFTLLVATVSGAALAIYIEHQL